MRLISSLIDMEQFGSGPILDHGDDYDKLRRNTLNASSDEGAVLDISPAPQP